MDFLVLSLSDPAKRSAPAQPLAPSDYPLHLQMEWHSAESKRQMAGVGVASLLCFSRLLRDMIYPLVILLQLVPKIAWTPLFIVWAGIGSPARLTIATFIAFFPIFISMVAGLEATDRSLFFGFVDDIAIRIRPLANQTRIDIRSVSRVGKHDFGANARRIKKFIDAALESVQER